MTLLREDDLADVEALAVRASEAEVKTWKGRRALRLVDGLAPIPDLEVENLSMGMRRPGNS